jgi:hypothetical protein
MKKFLSECKMVLEFCEMLKQKRKTFTVEVPFLHRSIDLVYKDEYGRFCAVEFKLRNWKQAITQAKDYMIGAELVFICIPKSIYNDNIKNNVLANACGLIVFDTEREEFKVIEPTRKEKFNKGRFLMEKGFRYAYDNNNYEYLLSLN